MEEIRFIIFYTCFILFISYITGLAGISFFSEELNISTDFKIDYNPLNAYYVFISLFISGLIPELTFIYTIIFIPYLIGLVYIIWKALPFT